MARDVQRESNVLNVLVCDDNRDHADSLGLLVKMGGHQVHIACDGASALEIALAIEPDIALLDIAMPLLSGHEIARRIRAQPLGNSVYLVAISAWGAQGDIRKSLDAGFDRHLTKPIELAALNSILNSRVLK